MCSSDLRFCHAFEIEGGNLVGNCSPQPLIAVKEKETEVVPPLEIGEPAMSLNMDKEREKVAVIDIMGPLSSFHYQVKNVRLLFVEGICCC